MAVAEHMAKPGYLYVIQMNSDHMPMADSPAKPGYLHVIQIHARHYMNTHTKPDGTCQRFTHAAFVYACHCMKFS